MKYIYRNLPKQYATKGRQSVNIDIRHLKFASYINERNQTLGRRTDDRIKNGIHDCFIARHNIKITVIFLNIHESRFPLHIKIIV